MSNFLQQMALSSAARVAAADPTYPASQLDRPSFPLRLQGFDLIAEIKNRSPAEGRLAGADANRAERARRYAEAGAAAISVLTEPDRFDGDLGHLREVVAAVSEYEVPVMRKDFLVDPRQVLEAKAAGASGVLLIAAMLTDDELQSMLDCAFEQDLFVLLESFDAADLARSAQLLQTASVREQAADNKFLVGVNSRDLRSLAVDPLRLRQLADSLPPGVHTVAESGLQTPEDAAGAAADGYSLGLVGTALMKSDDPGALIAAMLSAARGNAP